MSASDVKLIATQFLSNRLNGQPASQDEILLLSSFLDHDDAYTRRKVAEILAAAESRLPRDPAVVRNLREGMRTAPTLKDRIRCAIGLINVLSQEATECIPLLEFGLSQNLQRPLFDRISKDLACLKRLPAVESVPDVLEALDSPNDADRFRAAAYLVRRFPHDAFEALAMKWFSGGHRFPEFLDYVRVADCESPFTVWKAKFFFFGGVRNDAVPLRPAGPLLAKSEYYLQLRSAYTRKYVVRYLGKYDHALASDIYASADAMFLAKLDRDRQMNYSGHHHRFASWFARVVHNLVFDSAENVLDTSFRKKSRIGEPMRSLENLCGQEPADRATPVDELVANREAIDLIHDLLKRPYFQDLERRIITLRLETGDSFSKIAKEVGLTPTDARLLNDQAIELLRMLVQESGGE